MKKVFTKIICAVLAAIMVFSCTSVAFADNGITPVVVVHGVGGSPIYRNPDSDDRQQLGNFDIGSLFTSNNDVLHALLDATQGNVKDPVKFMDQVGRLLGGYAEMACDEDGNPAPDTGIANYWTDSLANHKDFLDSEQSSEPAVWKSIADRVGAENVYAFNYDWRLDACENGEKLDSFIEGVKQQTGKSKVTIIGASEGTVVVSAYVDAHKNDNEVEKIVYLNSAFNGVGISRLFAQDFVIDRDVIISYIANLTSTLRNNSFDLSRLTWISETATATVDNLCALLNQIKDDPALLNHLYLNVLKPALGCLPIMWEFIPYDCFDTAVEKMSAIGFLDKNSGLYAKISNYHAVQGRLVQNITELKNKGVQIAIVANYGIPDIPVTSDYAAQSDVLIETKYASIGATTADYGKTLPLSQIENNSYASLDEIVDASTCAFPDNTWFLKGVQHMGFWYGSGACNFVADLVTTKTPTNISDIKASLNIGQFVGTDDSLNITTIGISTPTASSITKFTKKTKSSVAVNWKKTSDVKGYEVQYSTSSKFTKSKTKTVKVTGAAKASITLKGLKKNKKYYVRVRTYKVVANQKAYSDWSAVKTVTTKK
ncbi:MAG: fibronectin type III domain-containing protein [Eubacterium sp.]